MRKRFVIANWKMNGNLAQNNAFIEEMKQLKLSNSQQNKVSETEVVICPPSPYLFQLSQAFVNVPIRVGAQNVNQNAKGAFTGEISCDMLWDFNCQYVIIGHSERRALYHETNELTAEKIIQVLTAGMTPILCIGESEAEREHGHTERVLAMQLHAVPSNVLKQCIIAYEPVWAIGTGKAATPEMANATHAFIRSQLPDASQSILYGGSVTAQNATALFSMPEIDGALVGGASLSASQFYQIIQAAA